jgi:HD-GYP domain-containing protein (c-di-GMP phosphodiesterase class II)
LVGILGVATALSGASDLRSLLHLILRTSRQLTASDAGSIYLVERPDRRSDPRPGESSPWSPGDPETIEGARLWFAASQNASLEQRARLEDVAAGDQPATVEDRLLNIRFPLTSRRLVGWSALTGEVLNIADVYALDPQLPYGFDASVDRELNYRAVSMLTVPLRTTAGEVVGVLQLINRRSSGEGEPLTAANAVACTRPFDGFDQSLIEALASQAAVCVERTRLIEDQARLVEAIIALVAGAIDAKSSHTGGHCARVPELALMLAREAEKEANGPLASFGFASEAEGREFRIGAWLHDCGKVTTPDFVVEKATKLETLHNRIHEIRTRFEVLLRDARIARLEGELAGGDPEALERVYRERKAELEEQFTFVAACNVGHEAMERGRIDRLAEIGSQVWLRHFDDSLGLSWQERELRQAAGSGGPAIDPGGGEATGASGGLEWPVPEALLADQPWHRIPRRASDIPDSSHGFRMAVPDLLYNHGELHNLGIVSGTLNAEERYKINEHIVQTILMLEALPLPSALARVPEYAGTHHETVIGTGYPRGLKGSDLSIPARIMAIADIFEALTAADRPYKKAKTLSQSVAILAGFRDRGHIDADLFDLFLRRGVHRVYAERFLRPEQIDDLDEMAYLR